MVNFLVIVTAVWLVVAVNCEETLPAKGVYTGSREDREKILQAYLKPLTPAQLEAVNNTNRVLREGVSAYKQAVQVLIQVASILEASAISGNAKCDAPLKNGWKYVEKARDCVPHLVQFNNDVLKHIEEEQQKDNTIEFESIKQFESEMIAQWGGKLLDCTENTKEEGLKNLGESINNYIRCTVQLNL